MRTLLFTDLVDSTPVLATTATVNSRVTLDIARQLGPQTLTLHGSLARSSLRLIVVPGFGSLEPQAWAADALDAFPGSGIVYALTIAKTERLAGLLRSATGSSSPAWLAKSSPTWR